VTRRTRYEYADPDDWSTRRTVEIDQWEGNWSGQGPVDMTGRPIQPGDWVAKVYQSGRSANMEVRQVREVRPARPRKDWRGEVVQDPTPRVYLSDSKTPVDYPGRMLVVPWDPAGGRVPGLNP